jgi:hypothetical protein
VALRDFDIIEDVKPIGGGWRYMQAQRDGSFQRIPAQGSAQTAWKLVEQVRTYRINEGCPMGDPERDVAEYIKKVSPLNDRFKGKGGVLNKPRPEPFIPLIQRLREWLDGISPKRPKLEGLTIAGERSEICLKCPQNIRWKTQCGECNDAIDYLGHTLRARTSYDLDDALHGCRVHGLHLPSAVFIDRDDLPAKMADAPQSCWLPNR